VILVTRNDCRHLLQIAVARLCPAAFVSSTGDGRLARLLGDFNYYRARARRSDTAERIAAALGGEATRTEVDRLTRESFRNGWVTAEVFAAQSFAGSAARRKAICAGLRIEGLHHLHEALARGRGALLLESWFGHRVLAKLALVEQGFRLTQVHGPTHPGPGSLLSRRVIRPMHLRASARLFEEIVVIQPDSVAYLRHLASLLGRNALVCIPSLGLLGQKFAPVDFLGDRRYFASGIVSLARATGAALIPIFCFRAGDGVWRLALEAPIAVPSGATGDASLVEVATTYVRLLESYVRRHPDQWLSWFPGRTEPTLTPAPRRGPA
jgi:lauroyl/myristoyl acyltransferase